MPVINCKLIRPERAAPGFFKGGGHLRSISKKKGGSRRGSNFALNVKKPTYWAKKGES